MKKYITSAIAIIVGLTAACLTGCTKSDEQKPVPATPANAGPGSQNDTGKTIDELDDAAKAGIPVAIYGPEPAGEQIPGYGNMDDIQNGNPEELGAIYGPEPGEVEDEQIQNGNPEELGAIYGPEPGEVEDDIDDLKNSADSREEICIYGPPEWFENQD